MGIRFACHHCNYSLHVKDFQGGKRGRCPECKEPFRIPLQDAAHSLELDGSGRKGTESQDDGILLLESEPRSGIAAGKLESHSNASSVTLSAKSATRAPQSELPGMPKMLADSPGAKWFVRPPTGGQFGPASSQLLMDWIMEQRVTPDSLVWKEGTSDWELASQFLPELYPDGASQSNTPVGTFNDFGAVFPARSKLANNLASDLTGQEDQSTSNASGSVSGSAIAKKRAKKRKQQLAIVLLLGLASLALLGSLVTVLLIQMSKT